MLDFIPALAISTFHRQASFFNEFAHCGSKTVYASTPGGGPGMESRIVV